MSSDFKVIFMGTPDFAVTSLHALIESGINVVAVITAPDKPAGRGQKLSESAVKKYAVENNLPVLQPTNLKDEDFITDLKSYEANLQVVVAFRMLPEVVWNMPEHGTINLHASLLPQYRGAAPINWAVINGEKESGVSTFFLKQKIDTGNIILQETVKINENDTAGVLHDNLMNTGANLLAKTVQMVIDGNVTDLDQEELFSSESELKHAPKIFKPDCKVNWNQSAQTVHNFVRGLSPYPTAWSILLNESGKEVSTKIFESRISDKNLTVGEISIQNNTLVVGCKSGSVEIIELQLAGKKRIKTADFLRGNQINNNWKFLS